MDDLGNVLLVGFALVCVLPLIIVLITGFIIYRLGRKQFDEFVNPDTTRLREEFDKLRAAKPKATTEQLVGTIIQRQAVKSGIVGAITGLGGFVTLPIALPVDIILSLRLQAGLVDFIASIYGGDAHGEREKQIRTYLIMTGSSKITETTTSLIMKYLLRIVGKSFSKIVPFLGAIVSFIVNYAIMQAMGRIATRYYTARTPARPQIQSA